MTPIDRPFFWIRRCAFCYRFTLFTRILLATAFIPTGMVKLMGERFTLIPVGNPIGDFFEAMYQTGFFWRFIGLAQIVAAVLLLIPRFAHLGAAIFLPIIINIFVITLSLNFAGTPVVTGLMLLAVTWLCVWDFHRFRPMLTTAPLEHAVHQPRLDRWEFAGFTIFGVCLMSVFGMIRGVIIPAFVPILIIAGFAAGLFTLARFLWVWWKDRTPAATT